MRERSSWFFMKNDSVRRIISLAVLLALCAATVAGLYLGVFGRTVDYAVIPTESGEERKPLNRQVAFIPNTINENWREAIRPDAKLGGGYSYTLPLDGSDADLKAAAKVLEARAASAAGSASAKVSDGAVTVTVAQDSYNATLAAMLSPVGAYDFVLYNASDNSTGDPVLTREHVKQAYYSTSNNAVQIQVVFNAKGVAAYNELRASSGGSALYLRLDGQPVASAYLSALNDGMLAFTANESSTAILAVSCMRSGALPSLAALQSSQAVTGGGAVDAVIIACALLMLLTAAYLLLKGRASGLAGIWAILAWTVLFGLFASLIAVNVSWIMSTLSMAVLVLCVVAFLYGLISLYGEMGKQIRNGRGAYAACADASRRQLKLQAILYGALLAVGALLMVIFRSGLYGVLGRIVAVAALTGFIMVALFPRVVLGCWAAVTGKK